MTNTDRIKLSIARMGMPLTMNQIKTMVKDLDYQEISTALASLQRAGWVSKDLIKNPFKSEVPNSRDEVYRYQYHPERLKVSKKADANTLDI